MQELINLTGKKFGKLTVVGFHHKNKQRCRFWDCHCDCGNDVILRQQNIIHHKNPSCGCTRKQIGKNSLRFNGYEEIPGSYLSVKRYKCKKSSREFSVSAKYLWELFLKQNRKCALSGLDIRFAKYQGDYEADASLDRIDSSKGYIEGNVQWVHKDVNYMKNEFDQNYFVNLCKRIVECKA